MSIDPVLRLIALHTSDLKDAEDILFPDGKFAAENGIDPIEDAVISFVALIENGICSDADEIQIDIDLAERVALALRQRKQAHRRPFLRQQQKQLRRATVSLAEQRTEELLRDGLRIGAARDQAAEEVSVRAHKSGDRIAASTLVRLMKQNAARRRVRDSKV
jgi:hypothetical protein